MVERTGGQTRTIFPRPHLSRHSRSDRRAAGSAYHHPPSWQVEDVRPGARPDAYPPGANALPYSWSFTDLNSFHSWPARPRGGYATTDHPLPRKLTGYSVAGGWFRCRRGLAQGVRQPRIRFDRNRHAGGDELLALVEELRAL